MAAGLRHINREAHADGVNAVAAVNQQALATLQLAAVEQADHPFENGVGEVAAISQQRLLGGVNQDH
jgi:hypothetical protein